MSRFFRKQKRRQEQKFRDLAEYSKAKGDNARRVVHHATTQEILNERRSISEAYDNIMMMFDVAVKRTEHFGRVMTLRLHMKMSVLLQCLKTQYVTVDEMEQIIQRETKVDMRYRHKPADKSWSSVTKAQYRVVNELSAVLMLALRDEFGFGKKRLERVFDEAADISQALKRKEMTYEQLKAEVA